jgi:hypothetical protein
MNISLTFKILPVAAATAILAACGGSDNPTAGSPEVPVPPVPFASPALIVPAGQASKVIPLSGCSNAQTATLTVNSSGDMILTGAPTGTTTIGEILRINYSTASYRYVEADINDVGPGVVRAYIHLRDASGNNIYSRNTSNYLIAYKQSNDTNYNCSLTNGSSSYALTVPPSSARLSSEMLSGITGITTTNVLSGTFTGGVAYWDNDRFVNGPDQNVRYFSLNMSTGAFTTSPSPSVPPTSVTSYPLTLPNNTSTYGFFSEEINNGQKNFYFEVGNNIRMYITRIGNILRPNNAWSD